MKKICILLVLFGVFYLCRIECFANSYINEEKIDGYLYKVNDSRTINVNYYSDKNNDFLYSYNFSNSVSGIDYYDKSDSIPKFLNLDKEKFDMIRNIMYYGYKYDNNDDLKWYVVTQLLIFRELSGLDIMVVKEDNIKEQVLIEEEKILLKLIEEHYIAPSFSLDSYDINLNEKILLEDKNNVLDLYYFNTNGYISIKKENNSISVVGNKPGEGYLFYSKPITGYSYDFVYFNFKNNDIFLKRTGNSSVDGKIPFNIHAGSLIIKNIDYYTGENIADGRTIFNVLNENDELVCQLRSGTGEFKSNILPIGNYKIRQVFITDYLKSDDILITINDGENLIEIKNKKLGNNLTINSKYLNLADNSIYDDNGSVFEIYNEDNVLLDKLNLAEAKNIYLPAGVYTIKQVSDMFDNQNEYIISINTNDSSNLDIFNELDYNKVIIEFLNIDTLPDVKEIYFIDQDNNKFLLTDYEYNDTTLVMNPKLSYGDYQVYIIFTDELYSLKPIEVSINNNSERIISNEAYIEENKASNEFFEDLNIPTEEKTPMVPLVNDEDTVDSKSVTEISYELPNTSLSSINYLYILLLLLFVIRKYAKSL